jgi:hypothetical protein
VNAYYSRTANAISEYIYIYIYICTLCNVLHLHFLFDMGVNTGISLKARIIDKVSE